MRINVTLTMTLEDEQGERLPDARAEEIADIAESVIRNRLMGDGFLPADVMVGKYCITHSLEAR